MRGSSVITIKCLNFMDYQSMRNKRRQGGRKSGRRVVFDLEEYTNIMSEHVGHLRGIKNGQPVRQLPVPHNPLTFATLNQYRSALWREWNEQYETNKTHLQWDQIWTQTLSDLMKQAQRRKSQAEKRNYVEKVQPHSVPYQIIYQFNNLEKAFWDFSNMAVKDRGCKKHRIYTWIRHRFVFLFTSHGLLRCETLHNGELSDLRVVLTMGVSFGRTAF